VGFARLLIQGGVGEGRCATLGSRRGLEATGTVTLRGGCIETITPLAGGCAFGRGGHTGADVGEANYSLFGCDRGAGGEGGEFCGFGGCG